MQARLIKGIQKPRPEFETVGACLIMLHGISDAGANFECWYVEFLGHQEQHPNSPANKLKSDQFSVLCQVKYYGNCSA